VAGCLRRANVDKKAQTNPKLYNTKSLQRANSNAKKENLMAHPENRHKCFVVPVARI